MVRVNALLLPNAVWSKMRINLQIKQLEQEQRRKGIFAWTVFLTNVLLRVYKIRPSPSLLVVLPFGRGYGGEKFQHKELPQRDTLVRDLFCKPKLRRLDAPEREYFSLNHVHVYSWDSYTLVLSESEKWYRHTATMCSKRAGANRTLT